VKGNAEGHSVVKVRNVHKERGMEKLYKNCQQNTWREKFVDISREKSLNRAAGHASFGPFGGVNDDLTEPIPTLIC